MHRNHLTPSMKRTTIFRLMNCRNTLSGCGVVFGVISLIVLVVLALYGLIQAVFAMFEWATGQTFKADPTIIAALITGAGTILGAVYIASYNARRAQERASEEANRGRKTEIYNRFVMSLTKTGNRQEVREGKLDEVDWGFVDEFASQIIIHGGPEVIKAYDALRRFGQEDVSMQTRREVYSRVANLLLKMRTELGLSNKGLTQNELLAPLIAGKGYESDNRPESL